MSKQRSQLKSNTGTLTRELIDLQRRYAKSKDPTEKEKLEQEIKSLTFKINNR